MKKIMAFALSFMFSLPIDSLAGTVTVESSEVSRVFVGYEHKGAFFNIADAVESNPARCSAGVPYTFVIDPSRSDVGHVVSVLLYAHSSGRKIDVEFFSDKCFSNHRVVRKIVVY